MPTRTKFTPKKERRNWQGRFLKALAESPSVTAAAQAAGISRRAAYDERERDKEFARQWDDAIEQAVDKLEASAFRRSSMSDTLTIFLLKAHRAKYRETNRQLSVTVTPDQLSQMTDDDLDRLIAALAGRA